MKAIWRLTVIAICLSSNLSRLPRAYAWGPGVDSDLLGTSAEFGSNFYLQTVTATGHFSVHADRPNSYFLMQERPDLTNADHPVQNAKAQAEASKLMNLSWFLGYAYFRSGAQDPVTTTQVYDDAHALRIGMNWELAERANIIASGGYQWMNVENYTQGMFELGFTYTIPLDNPTVWDQNTVDAEKYYVTKQQEDDREHLGAKDRFPNIRLGVWANYLKHTKSPTTSGRTAGAQLPGDVQMNESSSGPEIVLNLQRHLSFRFKTLFYFYDTTVANFLSYTTIGAIRPKANLAVADLEDTTPLLLVFPKRTVSGSMALSLGSTVQLLGELSYSTWDATNPAVAVGNVNTTFSAGGILDIALSQSWKVGASLDVTTATGYNATTGGVMLGYSL